MPSVKIRDGESFERALRRFTKACERAGILAEYRKRQQFEKPSEIKKRKLSAARRKQRRLMMMENNLGGVNK